MAKRKLKEKDIKEHLQREGFREIRETEKLTKWYKKASERPSCLGVIHKKKIKI
ncbi:MAG: hypothetical protein HXY52_00175 [Nitrospirae bacterium]|jgi:hypothetical protein|nr:hypothetical protein [Nitrospirota bacterium]